MKYSENEKSIQTSLKLFTNDLEDALKKISKQSVDLINGKDKEALNKLLNEYIQKRLSLKVNGELKKFTFVGFERESEAIWIYIEYAQTEAPKKIEIENTLLYDYIQGQINVVHFELNGKKQSSKVTNPEKNILFGF